MRYKSHWKFNTLTGRMIKYQGVRTYLLAVIEQLCGVVIIRNCNESSLFMVYLTGLVFNCNNLVFVFFYSVSFYLLLEKLLPLKFKVINFPFKNILQHLSKIRF